VTLETSCAYVEGRKRFVKGTLEDGKGELYARGEGVFVQVKESL
jgi:hypothetical protein